MGAQFGNWTFERRDQQALPLSALRQQLAPYGPDGEAHFHDECIDVIFYCLRETDGDASCEQPYPAGAAQVLTWDGRLDNREKLLEELPGAERAGDSDVAIVAAAYAHWGLACLPKLLGDWVLSIWDSRNQELVLAKDFLGSRPLFYSVDNIRAQWCSVLDPLVLFAGRQFQLNREYIAGWFGMFPASHLTPYLGVYSVPPASYVLVRKNAVEIREFWRFSPKRLVYASDAEYEEQFRQLLTQSVKRRLRSYAPVLAELSGGMDSSSIVCMADRVLQTAGSLAPRLDTISYYSADEPNWDELPYVLKVEELRGRAGVHLQIQTGDIFSFDFTGSHFMATPGSLEPVSKSDFELRRVLSAGGYRVVLSGIGGDEFLGGVPTPSPLLADLLVSGQWRTLGKQLLAWALALRIPIVSLLCETLELFFTAGRGSKTAHPPAWLSPDFRKAYVKALCGYPKRTRPFRSRPSFQDNLQTLEALRRQLSCYPLAAKPAYRKLYPYLDRDLLEFLFAIPPDQLFRPGQRRSLMRRALTGVVPQELLQRKRKAFVIRGPLMAISSQFPNLVEHAPRMLVNSIGLLLSKPFIAELEQARSGQPLAITPIIRAFAMERWFQNVSRWNVLRDFEACTSALPTQPVSEEQPAEPFS